MTETTDAPAAVPARTQMLGEFIGPRARYHQQADMLRKLHEALTDDWRPVAAVRVDGRGTATVAMTLAGRYKFNVRVTASGKATYVALTEPGPGSKPLFRVLSTARGEGRGWTEPLTQEQARGFRSWKNPRQPAQSHWAEFLVAWVRDASAAVDHRDVLRDLLDRAQKAADRAAVRSAELRRDLEESEQEFCDADAAVARLRLELGSDE